MPQVFSLCIEECYSTLHEQHPKDFEGLLVPAVGASGGVPVHPKDALLGLDLLILKTMVMSQYFLVEGSL